MLDDKPRLAWVSEVDLDAIREVRQLLEEYRRELDVDLCFQRFDEELHSLPGRYAGTRGRLLLATLDGTAVGCAALRELDEHTAELKRLFVRRHARGAGIGPLLVQRILAAASKLGFQRIRLDTLPSMTVARDLYRAAGFREIEPYTVNPIRGTSFMELSLEGAVAENAGGTSQNRDLPSQ